MIEGSKMRQEVVDFFSKQNISIDKMIHVGARRGIPRASIKQAAEEVYDDIKVFSLYGAEIEPIRLAWKVFGRSKTVTIDQKQEEDHRVEDLKALTNQLIKVVEDLKEEMVPWYKKLWRKHVN